MLKLFWNLAPKSPRLLPGKAALAAVFIVSSVSTGVSYANVVGSDTQNFNPVTSGLDFVTVHSSETLEPGYFNLGLFVNQAVNSLPYFEDSPQGRTKFTDSVLGADVNIGVGLLPNWDIGISLPQILNQEAQSDGFHGQFSQNGNTEIRINTKVRVWGTRDYGVALIGSTNINRIKNNPYIGEDAGPTYNLEIAADTTINKIALGINAGHRWRDPGEAIKKAEPIEPLGNQWIGSVAASYLFTSIDTKLIFEIFGSDSSKVESENSDRLASTAEALMGIKHDFTTSLAGHFGAGTELTHGRASPDWRMYAGLNWSVGPDFSKPNHPAPVEASGLPTPARFAKNDPFAGPPKAKEKIVIHDILFEFDSDNLVVGGTNDTLKRLTDYLMKGPGYTKLVIEGHSDSVGTDVYNINLSRRRATTIKKWLVKRHHLEAKRLEAVGHGERKPIADNGNYQGRQLNRRVEFTIYRDMK